MGLVVVVEGVLEMNVSFSLTIEAVAKEMAFEIAVKYFNKAFFMVPPTAELNWERFSEDTQQWWLAYARKWHFGLKD